MDNDNVEKILLQILENQKIMQNDITDLKGSHNNLKNRFNSFETRFYSLENKVDSLDTKLGSLKVKVNSLDNNLQDFRTETNIKLDNIQNQTDTIFKYVLINYEKISDNINFLAHKENKTEKEVFTLKNKVKCSIND